MNRPRNIAVTALAFGLSMLLAGCAGPGSYVVLLPSPDGSVGSVVVKGSQGEQVLTQARQGTALNGATPPFAVSQEQLTRDFGAAMAARPALPEQFLLYFERGAELTADSKALLARVLARAQARTAVDISVIGHSDTLGQAESNAALALVRANTIAAQLKEMGLQNAVMTVESHGERNLLISTADEVAEPRNRRVEVTLR
jgi:outer membrane protein OmpA-like peptidoglycan-associated protein